MRLTLLSISSRCGQEPCALRALPQAYLLGILRGAGHDLRRAAAGHGADDAVLLYLDEERQRQRAAALCRRELEAGRQVIALGPGAMGLAGSGAVIIRGEVEGWAQRLSCGDSLPRGAVVDAPETNLETLPWPCWDAFPELHRWRRGPNDRAPQLPLLVSRGGRERSAGAVDAELRWLQRRYALRSALLVKHDGHQELPWEALPRVRAGELPASPTETTALSWRRSPPPPSMAGQRGLLVTGATGALGQRLVAHLSRQPEGEDLLALRRRRRTRTPRRLRGLSFIWRREELRSLTLRDVSTVVHLASGRPRQSPHERRLADIEGTAALVAACERDGVERLVYVSCLEAVGRADSDLARRKREAEALVRASRLDWMILRPSEVLLPGGPRWGRLRAALRGRPSSATSPSKTAERPLFVHDLVTLLARLAGREHLGCEVHEVAGRATSERELLETAARIGEHERLREIALPAPLEASFGLLRALWSGDAALARAGSSTRTPLLGDEESARALGFVPSDIESGLRWLLTPPWPATP